MAWTVRLSNKAAKHYAKLPKQVRDILDGLMMEIRIAGPVRGNWPNYGKLTGNRHHCHLKKEKPTYVVVWSEDKETITVEVTYAGTHEKAPY